MADKDDRDTSLSGRSTSSKGSTASNARSDTPSSGRSVGSNAGSKSSSSTASRSGSSTSGAGAGRGTSIGGPSVSSSSAGRSSTAGGNTTARSSTGGIGSDRVASATPSQSAPTGYGFGNKRTSNMTAPATVAPTSTFTPRATSQTAKDLLAQAATLSARPGTSTLSARMTAPATVAPTATFTARAQMDAMESLRQASTLQSRPSTLDARMGVPPTTVASATEDVRRGLGVAGINPDSLPSSVNPIGNAKMAQSDEYAPSIPAPAPGNRVGFGAFTGTNLPSLDASRFGPTLSDIQRNAFDVQRGPEKIGSGYAPVETVSKATPPGGVGYGQSLDEAAAQVALNGTPTGGVPVGVQLAANTRSRSPAMGVDVLTPTMQVAANTRPRSPGPAPYTPASIIAARPARNANDARIAAAFDASAGPDALDRVATPEQVAEYEAGKVPSSADTAPQAPAADMPFDNADDYNSPPAKTVTKTGKTVPTTTKPADYKRSKAGWAKAIGIDIASALHPAGWAANLAAMALTGDSLGGAIADASGGKYGPNQYQQGSQHRDSDTSGGGPREASTANTTTIKPRPETTDDAGPTFEEKYLEFKDPTWRPTPIQKWGATPTHPEYS